jgi:hypothetical protein
MQTLMSPSSQAAMLQPYVARCERYGCYSPAIAKIENNSQCQEHFLAACHARLSEIGRLIEEKSLDAAATQDIRNFLAECTSAAIARASQADTMSNVERAEFLSVVLASAQMMTRLRRSPRISRQIPLRLVGDPRTDPRIEDAVTETVSQHGAMFNCQYPYAKGEILDILRLDTGRAAIARVAWHRPIGPAQHQVGVEILSRANFWN